MTRIKISEVFQKKVFNNIFIIKSPVVKHFPDSQAIFKIATANQIEVSTTGLIGSRATTPEYGLSRVSGHLELRGERFSISTNK